MTSNPIPASRTFHLPFDGKCRIASRRRFVLVRDNDLTAPITARVVARSDDRAGGDDFEPIPTKAERRRVREGAVGFHLAQSLKRTVP